MQLYGGPDLSGSRLTKAKNCHKRLVDAPLLLRADMANQFSEPAGVDRADLFD